MLQTKIPLANYRQVSNIRRTLVGNNIVDHSDVVGASPIFVLDLTPVFNGLSKDNCKTRREKFKFRDLVRLILELLRYTTVCVPVAVSCFKLNYYWTCSRVNVGISDTCHDNIFPRWKHEHSVHTWNRWEMIRCVCSWQVFQQCIVPDDEMFVSSKYFFWFWGFSCLPEPVSPVCFP